MSNNQAVSMEDEKQKNFTMNWNIEQKLAVLKSLCFIVGADKKIMSQEVQLLQGFLNRYGLNANAMNLQANMSQLEMAQIISALSPSDKRLVVSYWKQAIACDNDIADAEIDTLVNMAIDCDIDITDITI